MTSRAIAGWCAAGVALIAITVLLAAADHAFLATQHWTGWGLALAFGALALQGLRGVRQHWSASALLLLHLHIGWIATVLFFVHVGGFPGYPDSVFHQIQWITIATALLSGGLGYCLQRICSRRQRNWDALPIQRVAEQRGALASEAEEAFQRIVRRGAPTLLMRFYAQRLLPFLRAPRHLLHHWAGSRQPLDQLLLEMDYAGSGISEDPDFTRMREILARKAHLDERRALYWLQRGWLFFHLPASAAAAVLLPLHIILVHAYGG